MAADDISNVILPPVARVTDTNPRESAQESKTKEKNKNAGKLSKTGGKDRFTRDLKFEPTKHELGDIA